MEGSLVAYKVFTNGSTLQASELNENLMQQATAVFSNAAARTAAITSPVEGQMTYLEDVNRYDHWNGSAWVSPFGLTLINASTFSGVTAVNFDNVFSASYRNYKVVIDDVLNASGPNDLLYRLRNGGVDRTDSNYNWTNQLNAIGTGVLTNSSASGLTSGYFGGSRVGSELKISATFYSPFANVRTFIQSTGAAYVGNTTHFTDCLNLYQTVNQNDGFSLISASGNISGKIEIYGYRS
jgi:hypothetical protein